MRKRFSDLYSKENFFKPDKYNLDFWDKFFIIGVGALLTLLTVFLFFENLAPYAIEFAKIILILQTVTLIRFYQVRFKHRPVRNLLFCLTLLFFIFSFFCYLTIPNLASVKTELKLYRLPFLCFLFLFGGRQIFKLIFKREPIIIGRFGWRIGEDEYDVKPKLIFADYAWNFLSLMSLLPIMYLTFQ